MPIDGQEFQKLVITYQMYTQIIKDLVSLIKKSGCKFGSIYGIPRGGLPIAVHLSHHLDVQMSDCYNEDTLIVDDLIDTGLTSGGIRNLYPGIKIATLIYKPKADKYNNPPDFYCFTVDPNIWVTFPWEDVREIPNR